MKKRGLFFLISTVTILMISLSSCSRKEKAERPDVQEFLSADGPLGPFPETVTLTSWGGQEADKVFPPGEDWDNNIWTRGAADTLNIKFQWLWWAPMNEFIQKLNTSLAGGDFPEFQSRVSYEIYLRLAEAGKLAPLDEALERYGSDDLKELINSYRGQHRRKLTVNGRLYGISPPENSNPVMVGYIRKDWLSRAGKSVPENDYLTFTEDEFYGLVDQFSNTKKDGDAVMALSGDLFGAGFNLRMLFAMERAFPNIWVEKGGQLVYGSLTEESKNALKKMSALNAKGVFPRDFFVSNPWDIGEALIRPNVGIVLGYYWFPMWAYQTTKTSADIEWTPFLLKRMDGSLVITPMSLTPGDAMVMKAGTQYPEAVVKIANYSIENYYNNPEYAFVKDKDGNLVEPLYIPWGFAFSHLIEMHQIVDLMPSALKNQDSSQLAAKYQQTYDKLLEYRKTGNQDFIGDYGFQGPGGSFSYNAKLYRDPTLPVDAFQGIPSKKMNKNMNLLLSKRNEIFLKIITGELDADAFDSEWKLYWDNNGGSEVEQEVNDWYKTANGS